MFVVACDYRPDEESGSHAYLKTFGAYRNERDVDRYTGCDVGIRFRSYAWRIQVSANYMFCRHDQTITIYEKTAAGSQ